MELKSLSRVGLSVSKYDIRTNCRIKRYSNKQVLQVCNVDLFSTGKWERSDGLPMRDYFVPPKGQAEDPERSLTESQRRAKSKILDLALCNRFDYMFTWTLNAELIDRYDPVVVYKTVKDFLHNASKRKGFRYVLIPEYHAPDDNGNRAIHMHGLCVLGTVNISPALKDDGSQRHSKCGQPVFNMIDWKYGYSTCVPLNGDYERACGYITKYITKNSEKIFGKWYLSSRDLQKSPEIISVDRVSYDQFFDLDSQHSGLQHVSNVYGDIKILCEEYNNAGEKLYCSRGQASYDDDF